jgi:hypothetical protein
MRKLQKKFKTAYTAMEMKNWISVNILPHELLKQFVKRVEWQNYNLYIDSTIGTGYIKLIDYEIELDIELSVFGTMMSRTIESTFDKEFKKLESRNP